MCYFVTLGVPALGADAVLRALGASFDVRPSRNPSVRAAFPKNDKLFEITHGGCSCDLVEATSPPPHDNQRQREKYRRMGWSDAKIARALDGRRSAHQRRRQADAPMLAPAIAGLAEASGGARLLVHMYSGDIDREVVMPLGKQSVLVHDLVAKGGALPEDVVVDIRLANKPHERAGKGRRGDGNRRRAGRSAPRR